MSWLNWLTPAGAIGGMINNVVTPMADLMDEPTSRVYATLMAQYDAHLSAYSENVPFDITNTPRAQGLHARGAFNRQLFIPLLKKTGFGEEVSKEVVDYEGRFKLLASPIRAGATAAGRGTFGLLYAGVFGGRRYAESLSGMGNVFPAPSREVFPVVVNIPAIASPIGRPLLQSDIRGQWGTRDEVHPGIDIRAGLGTGLAAVARGEVVFSGFLGSSDYGWGNTVILRHEQNGFLFYSYYAHGAFDPEIAPGTRVEQGDVILRSGNTGKSFGAHLHLGFTVWDPRRERFLNVDPLQFLAGGSGTRRVRAREENDLIAETISAYERKRAGR
jgi:murein DD-endopeptidase MepM/ murein hydrolase activator NlpD